MPEDESFDCMPICAKDRPAPGRRFANPLIAPGGTPPENAPVDPCLPAIGPIAPMRPGAPIIPPGRAADGPADGPVMPAPGKALVDDCRSRLAVGKRSPALIVPLCPNDAAVGLLLLAAI